MVKVVGPAFVNAASGALGMLKSMEKDAPKEPSNFATRRLQLQHASMACAFGVFGSAFIFMMCMAHELFLVTPDELKRAPVSIWLIRALLALSTLQVILMVAYAFQLFFSYRAIKREFEADQQINTSQRQAA